MRFLRIPLRQPRKTTRRAHLMQTLRVCVRSVCARRKIQRMAIYHFSAKIISRRDERSSTACASYRAGELVIDTRTGEVHDYTRKRGVLHTQIVMPHGCAWAPTRAELWNAVEHKNKRADAQLAREFVVALPDELGLDAQRQLAQQFAADLSNRYNIGVDLALHAASKEGDQRNTHCHFLTTTNTIKEGGGLGNKQRELDLIAHNSSADRYGSANAIDALREHWENLCNQALVRVGADSRVDRRTLAEQGIERAPQTHLGPIATAIERKGKRSKRGEYADAKSAEFAAIAAEEGTLAAEEVGELRENLAALEALRDETEWDYQNGLISEQEYRRITHDAWAGADLPMPEAPIPPPPPPPAPPVAPPKPGGSDGFGPR